MSKNDFLEVELLRQMKLAGLPEPVREYKAIPSRRFRWDMAWPESRLLVEVQGAVWVKGGHSTGGGINRDCEKSNLATLDGWRCLSFTKDMIKDGRALAWMQAAHVAFPPF